MKVLALSLLLVWLPASVTAGPMICFSDNSAVLLLRCIEERRFLDEKIEACHAYELGAEDMIRTLKERAVLLDGRIVTVEGERDEALRLAEETAKVAKKLERPWYKRAWDAGKWILGGALVGFAVGAASR